MKVALIVAPLVAAGCGSDASPRPVASEAPAPGSGGASGAPAAVTGGAWGSAGMGGAAGGQGMGGAAGGQGMGGAAGGTAGTECLSPEALPPGAVLTDRGAVSGVTNATSGGSVTAYLGIPYAAPPVGSLRWRPPAQAACWSGIRDGSALGSPCPQLEEGVVVGQEDCLSLNVWVPEATGAPSSRPVLVWIHGGGNQLGSSAEPRYDGAALAGRTGAIVVSLNYRLGALGFLALPALRSESDHAASGNYGILDQIEALRWVQRNVQAFGGDPARVTIFGQSAGAQNAWILLASPLASGLFSGMIAHSGLGLTSTSTEVETIGAEVQAAIGCAGSDPLVCLRASSFDAVTRAVPGEGGVGQRKVYVPNVDGWVLPMAPIRAITQGTHNRVPVISGTTTEETMFDFGAVPDEVQYQAMAHAFYDAQYGAPAVDRALALYPVAEFGTPRAALVALTTDQRFVCPLGATLSLLDTAQEEPVFRYVFSYPSEHLLAGSVTETLRPFGAFHLWDIYFLFQTFETLGSGTYQATPADRTLADEMGGYWGRFASSGDPNGAAAVIWPTYRAAEDPYLELGATIRSSSRYRASRCELWSSL